MLSHIGLRVCLVLLTLPLPAALAVDSPTDSYLKLHQLELKMTKYEDTFAWRTKRSIAKDPKLSDKENDQIVGLMKMMMPKSVKVLSATINGQEATLKAIAPPGLNDDPKSKTMGTIIMLHEDKEWKIDTEKWSTKIGE